MVFWRCLRHYYVFMIAKISKKKFFSLNFYLILGFFSSRCFKWLSLFTMREDWMEDSVIQWLRLSQEKINKKRRTQSICSWKLRWEPWQSQERTERPKSVSILFHQEVEDSTKLQNLVYYNILSCTICMLLFISLYLKFLSFLCCSR